MEKGTATRWLNESAAAIMHGGTNEKCPLLHCRGVL
jgi:hypothetical protein